MVSLWNFIKGAEANRNETRRPRRRKKRQTQSSYTSSWEISQIRIQEEKTAAQNRIRLAIIALSYINSLLSLQGSNHIVKVEQTAAQNRTAQ